MSSAARRSHRGDKYQIAVAAHWVARLLSDETIDSVRVDAVALPGDGGQIHVDDIVIGYSDGAWRFIQAKKNQPNHSEWSLSDSVLRKGLCKARDQLESKPTARVEFCSRSPFGDLAKLIEDGADYPDHAAFSVNAPATLKAPLARLLDFADSVEQHADSALLFIKGDQFARCATEADLIVARLPTDLVPRAARLARHRRVVIVIDSLDVLSLHREHRSLRLFLTLIDRLQRLTNLCVVTACRTFDLRCG